MDEDESGQHSTLTFSRHMPQHWDTHTNPHVHRKLQMKPQKPYKTPRKHDLKKIENSLKLKPR